MGTQKYGDRVICDENDQWFHVPDGDYRWNSKVTRPYLKSKLCKRTVVL